MRMHLRRLLTAAGAAFSLGACNSTVTVVTDDGAGASGTQGECVPCTPKGIDDHYIFNVPFCAGDDAAKYEALIACACQESTCARPENAQECYQSGPNAFYLCNGGLLGQGCQDCLEEKCPDAWRACCPKGEFCEF